jgi:REP element-mobilizing transposase RayT
MCTYQRELLLGQIDQGEMVPNRYGLIVQKCWHDLPNHYPHIELDAFVVMPNHVHGIIVINTGRGGSLSITQTASERDIEIQLPTKDAKEIRPYMRSMRHGLPEIIRAFKSFSARRINNVRKTPGTPVWQRSYYEHIIRDEPDWERIWDYIISNPQNWQKDKNNPNPHDQ